MSPQRMKAIDSVCDVVRAGKSRPETGTLGFADQLDAVEALWEYMRGHDVRFGLLGSPRVRGTAVYSDFDLVVPPRDFRTLPGVLSSFAKAHGGRLVQKLRHEITAVYYVLVLPSAGAHIWLAIDVCTDYRWNGRLLIRWEELLSPPSRLAALAVTPRANFLYYLVKRASKGALDGDSLEILRSLHSEDKSGVESELRRHFPESAVEVILETVEEGHIARIKEVSAKIRADYRAPRTSFRPFIGEVGRKIDRWLHPTGVVVALLGPDGSGKSTLLECLVEGLAPAFRATWSYHLRPDLLRFGRQRSRGPVLEPHGKPPRSSFASVAKLGYLAADYSLGYAFRIRPRTVRSGLVVFDRYFHDVVADPRRYRYAGPPSFTRALGTVVPVPDVTLVLSAAPAVIANRKTEVSTSEQERQFEAYRSLAGSIPNAHLLDASQPADKVANEAIEILLDHLERRTERRLAR